MLRLLTHAVTRRTRIALSTPRTHSHARTFASIACRSAAPTPTRKKQISRIALSHSTMASLPSPLPLAAASLIDEPPASTAAAAATTAIPAAGMSPVASPVDASVNAQDSKMEDAADASVAAAPSRAPSKGRRKRSATGARKDSSSGNAGAAVTVAPPPEPQAANGEDSMPPPPPKRRRSIRKPDVELSRAVSSPVAAAMVPAGSAAFAASATAADVPSETLSTQDIVPFDAVASIERTESSVVDASTGELLSRTVSETAVVAVTTPPKPRKKKKFVIPDYDASHYHPQALVSRRFIGAHVSAAGGPQYAVLNAASIGARAFAMDTRSKRKWTSPPMDPSDALAFREAVTALKFSTEHILPHGSYLMNLASPNTEVRDKSKECLLAELERCGALGLHLYNFVSRFGNAQHAHPGSTCGQISKQEGMDSIASCLNVAHRATAGLNGGRGVVTVLENMAGSKNDSIVGSSFEDLRYIIDRIDDKSRVGVCIDTCHAFAAGYDLRTADAVAEMLTRFDAIVGLKYLRGFHLNDSKGELGCKKDRHESIGVGCIGTEGFRALMRHKALENLPLILETPCKDMKHARAKYANEIAALYELETDALPETRADRPLPLPEPAEAEEKDGKDDDADEDEDDDEDEKPKSKSKKSASAPAQLARSKSAPNGRGAKAAKAAAFAAAAATPADDDASMEDSDDDEPVPRKPAVKRRKSATKAAE